MTTVATKLPQPIRSTIPARLDRLGSIIGTLAAFLLLNSLPENTGWNPGCG
jgi:hypothetical protein